MNTQRCLILIDGSNFYFKLKDLKLHNLLEFDFSKFAKFLARSKKIVESRYYVGRVRQDGTAHAEKMLANQQKLFESLKSHKFQYTLGYLLKSDGRYHEKGVDVQIAVDILVSTYKNKCDRIILVSSDTDLEPAINVARAKGKMIEYIGFSHKPSVAMVRFSSESRLLTKEELSDFIKVKK
ncbi:MAG: NYN domain-containing protein [Candidatus Levybacteria bacterium]|nr:NYN domain-containing protein [Candidatus Levybacteria bacterium]